MELTILQNQYNMSVNTLAEHSLKLRENPEDERAAGERKDTMDRDTREERLAAIEARRAELRSEREALIDQRMDARERGAPRAELRRLDLEIIAVLERLNVLAADEWRLGGEKR